MLNFDSRSALAWIKAGEGGQDPISNQDIASRLRLRGDRVDQSTLSRFATEGWVQGRDIAGLASMFLNELFSTTSGIALEAQHVERRLRLTIGMVEFQHIDQILEAANDNIADLRRRRAQQRPVRDIDDAAERNLDLAAIQSLEGHVARYRDDYESASTQFSKAAQFAAAPDLAASDGAQIIRVRAEANAFDSAWRADSASGPAHPYGGRTGAALDRFTSPQSVQLALKIAARLGDPRILFNLAEALLLRGLAAPSHVAAPHSCRSLISQSGKVLLTAWDIDPSPDRAASVATWGLPGFGYPHADPRWSPALDVAIRLAATQPE